MRSFLVPACLLCGVETPSTLALCSGCKAALPWIESGCLTCGLPLPTHAQQYQCGECLTGTSPFTLAVTPLFYKKPLSKIITSFKHHRGLAQGHVLAHLLAAEVRDQYIETDLPEVIIPVPLHWRRFLWRGYNQSAELGKQLSQELKIPCRNDFLKRTRRTPSQQGLSRQQRLRNLTGAFQLQKNIPFTRVALLDDVVTTGSTTAEIAQLLLKQGVLEVHLWAIARTPVKT